MSNSKIERLTRSHHQQQHEPRIPLVTAGTLQIAAGIAMAVLLGSGPVLGSRGVEIFAGIAAAAFAVQGVATLALSGRSSDGRPVVASILADCVIALAAILVMGMCWRDTTLAGTYLGLGVIAAAVISAVAIAISSMME